MSIPEPQVPELGRVRCCVCEADAPQRNVVMLEFRAPWEYPTIGDVITKQRGRALAVICDRCADARSEPVYAVQFRPDGQIIYHSIAELRSGEPWATKTYQVFRTEDDVVHCAVIDQHGKDYPLPHWSYHSPTGFEVGYGGSGPADLALAIACDHFGVEVDFDFSKLTSAETERDKRARRAWGLHQPLKWAYLAVPSVRGGVRITDREVSEVARRGNIERG